MASLAWIRQSRINPLRELRVNLEKLDCRPGLILKSASRILSALKVKNISGLSIERLLSVFDIDFSEPNPNSLIDKSLNLLFVSTNKDFKMLPLSIEGGFYSTTNFREVFATVIVPDDQVAECISILGKLQEKYPIEILAESSIVPDKYLDDLKIKFGWRFGWVLQQILKTKFSTDSEYDFVLIIDSDTVLLRKRNWVLENGKQLLTPSWEYNPSYYRFLNTQGLFPLHPKYTFVSHHMLTQPYLFKKATEMLGWSTLDQLVKTLIEYESGGELSPFCIEYELYGQYMYLFESESCFLEKWGNTSIPAQTLLKFSGYEEIRKKYALSLASVSAHSYLTVK
jgi:hypothetical protein